MSFHVKRIGSYLWKEMMAKDAHELVFGETRSLDLDKCTHAYLCIDSKDEIAGYVTTIDMDSETLYWQHGGAMPEKRGTVLTISGMSKVLNACKEFGYKRVWFRVKNDNLPMLKLGLALGFKVIGTRFFENEIFVEMQNEF